jgi:hypothetical protein
MHRRKVVAVENHRFVPKVHPSTRAVEPEDPMTLYAIPAAGDPEDMLRVLIQEYAWMGWRSDQILALFRDPFYPALHALWSLYGEKGIREKIGVLLRQSGAFRFKETIRNEPEATETAPELIQLGFRTRPEELLKGGSHAEGQ